MYKYKEQLKSTTIRMSIEHYSIEQTVNQIDTSWWITHLQGLLNIFSVIVITLSI